MVTAAGLYAALYALGRLLGNRALKNLSYAFAVLEVLGAIGMVYPDFLDPLWRALILVSAVVYLFLPQVMWRVVTTVHRRESWGATRYSASLLRQDMPLGARNRKSLETRASGRRSPSL